MVKYEDGCLEVLAHEDSVNEISSPHRRMMELKECIKACTREAMGIVREHGKNPEGAKGYWYAQIMTALDNEHEFLGGCMQTMESHANGVPGSEDNEECEECGCEELDEGVCVECGWS